jgi:pimeloyl-ACP methyl ester carboxylesterase
VLTERTIRLATGLDYHLLEWGTPSTDSGLTVLLLHGFLDLARGWQDLVEAGLDRFHVIAPDLRGHGDSGWIGAGGYYHFADYLADVDDLLRGVARAPRLAIVGHSMGGSIASMYTGSFPDRVDHLALLEGMGPPEMIDLGPERIVGWLAAWQRVRDRPQRTYGSVAEAAARLREHDALLEPALAERLARWGTRPGPDGRLRFKHDPLHATMGPYAFRVEAAQRFWRNIRCPVLLVEGAESTFRHGEEEAARRRACLANATQVTLPGAGHMMQRHQPRALAAELVDFLSRR